MTHQPSTARFVRVLAPEFVPALLILLVIFLAAIDSGLAEDWVLPPGQLARGWVGACMWAGFLLGLVQGGWERFTTTADYVRHRGMGLRRMDLLTTGLSCATLALAAAVGVGIRLGWNAWSDPNAGAADWSRIGWLVGLGLTGLQGFAIAMWSIRLRAGAGLRFALGVAGVFALFQVAAFTSPADLGWALFLSVQLVITIPLLVLAERSWLQGTDTDLPLPRGDALVQSPVACAVGALGACLLAWSIQGGLHARWVEHAVGIVRTSDREWILGGDDTGTGVGATGGGELARVDAQGSWLTPDGRPSERRVTLEGSTFFSPVLAHWKASRVPALQHAIELGRYSYQGSIRVGGPWEILSRTADEQSYLDRSTGLVHAVFLASESRARGRREVFDTRGPVVEERAPAPFPAQVEILGPVSVTSSHAQVLLGDRRRGELWAFGMGADGAQLQALALPDGDPGYSGWDLGTNSTRPLVVEGARAAYEWDGEQFHALAGESLAAWERYRAAADLVPQVEIDRPDPVAFRVGIVEPASGVELFQHEYGARGGVQGAREDGMQLLSLLRPPLLLLASHAGLGPDDMPHQATFERAFFLDPLVAHGKRPGLVALAWGLVIVLAAWTAWRLRRWPVSTDRVGMWVLLVLLLGPTAFLVGLGLETRRAWRQVPVSEPLPPARPLIQTA